MKNQTALGRALDNKLLYLGDYVGKNSVTGL